MNKKYEFEEDFSKIFMEPSRLFGLIFPVMILLVIIIGVYYLSTLNYYLPNKVLNVKIDSLEVRREIVQAKGGVIPSVDLSKISNPDGSFIEKGKELYDANCQSCHGLNGLGDGAAGIALNPKPRNFTDTEGWTNGTEFISIYKTLQEGIIQNGMSAYEYISPEDRIAIIHYLRTFGVFPELSENEVNELINTYNLDKQTLKPNTIPIEISIKKILEENYTEKLVKDSLKSKLHNILMSDSFLKAIISDPLKFSNSVSRILLSDKEKIIKIIESDPFSLGLSAEVLKLNKNDFNLLIEKLSGLLNNENV